MRMATLFSALLSDRPAASHARPAEAHPVIEPMEERRLMSVGGWVPIVGDWDGDGTTSAAQRTTLSGHQCLVFYVGGT